jgi:hypothetical protein
MRGREMKSQEEITPIKLRRAVYKALKHWDLPSREGTEIFMRLKVAQSYGLRPNLHIVDCRIALDRMLTAQIEQLRKLQPVLANILIRRFQDKEGIKSIALKMSMSEEQINRKQKSGIIFLSEFIYDEELRQRSINW